MGGVAIVGCGLVGTKRAQALASGQLRVCADLDRERAERLARPAGALATTDWRHAVERNDVDLVIVATTNDALAEVAVGALEAGKHVLVEKPAARSLAELAQIEEAATRSGRLVRVGFNHRYHPAVLQARRLFEAGALGELMFIRGRYGHGGRVGYDREWRADPARSGGGELIDQGVHVIDLARWFLGDFTEWYGFAHTYYWDMPVEDNAFLTLKTARQQVAFLHVSCTEWKNLFSFEIYGRSAKLHIEGLGGSYGTERIAFYKMLPEMGPPETTIWEYPMGDRSWAIELQEFLEDIRLDRPPAAGLAEARACLAIVEQVYKASGYARP
ncbi:MAG: Gfo/Idh/MocA family oxidoreductase [Chloroflexota bacterium]|nr:Gfo/Idh/MocA family oxidoreductase [Dehalococcoidia bacterium]MDW8252875.1 Gfo/Idh/MocA family oxidoreductase [Chloroflexota bacterium]